MLKVGLTGNIASGKSSVAREWAALGATVIDADLLARQAVEPGTPALRAIVEEWGPTVLDEHGGIDRSALREIVFRDPAARARLEAITHPAVRELRDQAYRAAEARGERLVVADVPLLFEVGLEGEFDVVVLVDAPAALRLDRLVRDRGLDREAAERMIAAQMPAESKRGRTDIVIPNAGGLAELRDRAREAWRTLLARAAEADPSMVAAPRRLRMDMHCHTNASFDCLSSPDRVLGAARRQGLDRLVITDHNEIHGALRLQQLDPELILVGEEVKTRERVDVIGILLTERIPRGTPARETCERIRAQGGIVYMPHPFDTRRAGGGRLLDELAELIDVVEVHNARSSLRRNREAEQWALARGKPAGAGSDAHTPAEIGRGVVEVPPFDATRASLLDALVAGTIVRRQRSPAACHLWSTYAKLRKRLPGA